MYPYLLMVFVVFCYAGNILVGKAINELPPFTIAFFRVFVAFVVLIPFGMRSAWKTRFTLWEHRWPFLIMTLTGVTFFNTFIYGALQFTTATNVAVLETVIPVLTVLLSVYLLKERLRGIQLVGILMSFLGALWVVMDGRILEMTSIAWNIGDGIMIGAILTWVVYSIYVKKYMHLFPPFASLFVMTGLSFIVLLPIVIVEWSVVGVPTFVLSDHLISFLYLGIFPSLIALIFYNRAVDLLSASQASVFLNLMPIVTMVGAYFWLGESISFMEITGTIIVISGVMLVTQFNPKQRKLPINAPESQSL